MNDLTQEHPEFFKAPSERDVPAEPATVATIDDILDEVTPAAPILGQIAVRPASNRRDGALIALFGGLLFALLYAAAAFGTIALRQPTEFVYSSTLSFLATPIFWLTSALFTGLFALLAILVNRGPWISFVAGSFVLSVLTYAAALGAGLISIHAWALTFVEARTTLWDNIAFSPLVLIAPILGREIPLWLGVWISRRGKRLREGATLTATATATAAATAVLPPASLQ